MLDRHGVERRGVIHVGANTGVEVPFYRQAGFDLIRLVEPIPKLAAGLPEDCDVIQGAVAGRRGQAELYVTPWSEQSSLLVPKSKRVVETLTVETWPLADLQEGCNVCAVDVQGAEAEVLRSGDLDRLDLVIVEMAARNRYRGGASPQDVIDTLDGFELVAEFPHRASMISDGVFLRCA